MPTYDYQCTKCRHRFEVFHGIKDEKPRRCPRCRARARRVPAGGAGLLFKGSGFYITDYRSSSYREKARQESGGKSGEGKSGEGKSAEGKSGDGKSGDAPSPPRASGEKRSGGRSAGKPDRVRKPSTPSS